MLSFLNIFYIFHIIPYMPYVLLHSSDVRIVSPEEMSQNDTKWLGESELLTGPVHKSALTSQDQEKDQDRILKQGFPTARTYFIE